MIDEHDDYNFAQQSGLEYNLDDNIQDVDDIEAKMKLEEAMWFTSKNWG